MKPASFSAGSVIKMTETKKRFNDFLRPKALLYAASVFLAVCGVFLGIVPYLAVYSLLLCLAEGQCSLNSVMIYSLAAILAFSLQLLCHYLSTAISHKTAFAILENIRIAITKKMMKMPLGYTQMKGGGCFKDLLIDKIERLEYPLAHAIPEITSGMLMPVVVMGILFFMDWRMALAATIPTVATLLFYLPMYLGIMNEFANTYYSALADMNGKVIEYIRGIKEIKIFGRAKDAYSQYEASIDKYKNSTLRLYNKMYFVSSPAFVLLSSILVSVLCVGGLLYCGGSLSLSLYLFTIVLSLGIGAPLLKFTEFMDNFFNIQNGKRLINEILSAPELPQVERIHVDVSGHEIVFHNVSFAYDEKTILDDISLTFRENQKTALVGPSGSGKTTVANLVARFWDVSGGSITMGGVDYRDIPLTQLMENINYVTQDTFLFNMSVRENILVGNPNASEEEIMNAARAAQCEEFISELEHGYDTIVGDAGAKLSGGQRQRIVIARAILKNAPVLILDEATAYADMENQQKIQSSLQVLCRDKTLIIIAHRLSTVIDCDQIIVIEDGKVNARGTHESLLETSKLYRHMWSLHSASTGWGENTDMEVEPC
jgi:ATP-binding cassette subfamily B protein IrtA